MGKLKMEKMIILVLLMSSVIIALKKHGVSRGIICGRAGCSGKSEAALPVAGPC
jgi:hypothetical protein